MNGSFTRTDSQIVKGVAILMMMWHHCFLSGRFESYSISLWPLTLGNVTRIAAFCKICVSLFAFVSGYGLCQSYADTARDAGSNLSWIKNRYIKSFSGYWIIVLLSWIVCTAIDLRTKTVYGCGNLLISLVYGLVDFLGLSNLFGSPTMCGTWWYMSACAAFIVLTPILYKSLCRFGTLVMASVVILIPRAFSFQPGGTAVYSFLLAYLMGMSFQRQNLFSRIDEFHRKHRFWTTLSLFCLCILLYFIYVRLPTDKFWDVKWGLFPLPFIVFIHLVPARIPVVNTVLKWLGKHSANVFMVHTFIRDIYLKDIVYGFRHFSLTLLFLLGASLLISILLEFGKKLLGFDAVIGRLLAGKGETAVRSKT